MLDDVLDDMREVSDAVVLAIEALEVVVKDEVTIAIFEPDAVDGTPGVELVDVMVVAALRKWSKTDVAAPVYTPPTRVTVLAPVVVTWVDSSRVLAESSRAQPPASASSTTRPEIGSQVVKRLATPPPML